jgi:phage nucleotide-binding protein
VVKLIVSHSRIECFKSCPFRYDLRYNKEINTIPNDEADNALFLGTAMHAGLEKGVEAAIKEYFNQYPVITDAHVNEQIKLEVMIPKAKKMIPHGEYEVKIEDEDFKGFIDLLAPVTSDTRLGGDYQELPDVYDLYDFKYSNNVSHYKDSVQVHLYKYFFEKMNPGKKIRNLYYLCVPKVSIKQKKTETLNQFRQRIQEELSKAEPQLIQVEYDQSKVIEWMFSVKHTIEAVDFPKNQSWLCRYCEYNDYCQKGVDFMLLPKNERRNIETVEKKVVWLYGSPFSGKTTFANRFPDPLMLNTDGNIKFVDSPYISIKDKIEVTGRMTKKTLAWEIFKDVIAELEKKDNDFKTIVVDLLEDCYEYCRLYMYDQMGISHESDDSFRAWDKVRTEFLSTLKRLMALDYENIILISHEDCSKDITKKGGDKLTSIKPNLQDKVATKVAGMVDIVARVVADGDVRVLSFKSNEVIFGGGRLTTKTNEIALDYDAFLEVYEEANKAAVASMTGNKPETEKKPSKGRNTKVQEETHSDDENMSSDSASEQEEPEISVVEDDEAYFYDESNNNYLKKHKGDVIEDGWKAITKEEFGEGIKRVAQQGSVDEDKPRTRTRKKRGEN